MDSPARIPPKPYISLHHITKRFGSVLANQDVSLDFIEGEVHAIVGENGAGKSTLMKILSGHLQPDSGELWLNGSRVTFPRPQDATRAGIGIAHQSFLIFPQLTALENVIVGCEPVVHGWIKHKQAKDELTHLCRSVGFDLSLSALASQLSFAHRQQIEILRLLYRKVKVFILDEPTSLLTPPEAERFLKLLQTLQAAGHTILFVSHRLHEIFAIAQRVSVLSRGAFAGSYPIAEIDANRLARLVVAGGKPGSPADQAPEAHALESHDQVKSNHFVIKQSPASSEDRSHEAHVPAQDLALGTHHDIPLLLELNEISTQAGSQEGRLDGFSLKIAEGEVFGLGGVVGNGQRTLALLLSGMLPAEKGTVFLSGEEITHLSPGRRLAMGLRWLPANPVEEAQLPSRSLWENLLLGRQRERPYQQHGWLDRMAISSWAAEQLHRNEVVYASLSDPLNSLSGGNQQKLALSRVLKGSPRLIILEQPSRGLDLRAQEHLRHQVRKLNDQGVTFLLISYDLDELLALSHRVGILYRGRMMGIVRPIEASDELLGRWMLGLESDT